MSDKKTFEKDPARRALGKYVRHGEIIDFNAFDMPKKLALLQNTPPEFIKERSIAGKVFKYVEHTYAKKALNFIFGFGVSAEMIKEDFIEYVEEYRNYKSKDCKRDNQGNIIPVIEKREVIEASVVMKFTFTTKDFKESRTVRASHKGYKNPAITKSNIMEAAYSKSWTKVAATFGIGTELEREFDLQVDSEPDIIEIVTKDTTEKNFNLPY